MRIGAPRIGTGRPPPGSRRGAFVVSLDFELLWGMRDLLPPDGGAYRENLLGARCAVPALLRRFESHGVHATWATVGFLFARTRDELRDHWPASRPAYEDRRLSPYADAIGRDEREDPLHFGASLVDAIRATPGQELGTHTFSHYYCSEPGQTHETFEADLDAALRIAAARGVRLRSIVFPRNQLEETYLPALRDRGLVAFRGNPRGWPYRAGGRGIARRAARLLDAYAPVSAAPARWDEVVRPDGLCDVRATLFLRPFEAQLRGLEELRLARIAEAIRSAARSGGVIHLWWHPHNFGRDLEANLAFLERILRVVAECRDRDGMESLSMFEVAERSRAAGPRGVEGHG